MIYNQVAYHYFLNNLRNRDCARSSAEQAKLSTAEPSHANTDTGRVRVFLCLRQWLSRRISGCYNINKDGEEKGHSKVWRRQKAKEEQPGRPLQERAVSRQAEEMLQEKAGKGKGRRRAGGRVQAEVGRLGAVPSRRRAVH